jgi:hypothetical protein
MNRDRFQFGLWNVICDRCGFKRKSNEVLKTWDNLYVCAPSTGKTCYETRHPQDFVRSKPDQEAVAFTRPDRDLDSNGQPRLDQSPTFNCNAAEPSPVSPIVSVSTTVYKGYCLGPVTVTSGTLTIVCSLEIS